MANKQRGYVEIELDRKRNLRFTLNSLTEIEDKLGISIADMAGDNLSMKAVRTFLWAGLIHEDKEITEDMVGDMVDFENFEYVQECIAKAFELATRKNSQKPVGTK